MHDPSKVAVCKEFLHTGTCHKGSSCNLSHETTPNRVPACVHFVRGNCRDGAKCRYAHVKVNPTAPVCPAFAKLGFCEAGADCLNRHEHECPDYSANGQCNDPRCRLPHIDRAGQLRQPTTNTAQTNGTTNVNSTGNTNPILDSLDAALNSPTNHLSKEAATPMDKIRAQPGPKSTFTQENNFLSLDDDTDGVFEKKFLSDN